jgi:NAD(P)-dependent dehydrogenase (short-subunit alcohol dehydrogenase family)
MRDRCAVYAADVQRSTASSAPAAPASPTQGLPDVVIANAGISVGMDSAARGPGRDARHLRHQQRRPGRHLPSVRGADAPARQRHAGGRGQRGGIRGLPGHGAYCASKAGVVAYCESLRGECRRSACVW